MAKKKHQGHYCKVCQSLPADEQADMRRCRDVERLFGKSLSRKDWELLEKYTKKYAGFRSSINGYCFCCNRYAQSNHCT